MDEQERRNKVYSRRARLRELVNADKSRMRKGGMNEPVKVEIRQNIAELRLLGDRDYIADYAKEYIA